MNYALSYYALHHLRLAALLHMDEVNASGRHFVNGLVVIRLFIVHQVSSSVVEPYLRIFWQATNEQLALFGYHAHFPLVATNSLVVGNHTIAVDLYRYTETLGVQLLHRRDV